MRPTQLSQSSFHWLIPLPVFRPHHLPLLSRFNGKHKEKETKVTKKLARNLVKTLNTQQQTDRTRQTLYIPDVISTTSHTYVSKKLNRTWDTLSLLLYALTYIPVLFWNFKHIDFEFRPRTIFYAVKAFRKL